MVYQKVNVCHYQHLGGGGGGQNSVAAESGSTASGVELYANLSVCIQYLGGRL